MEEGRKQRAKKAKTPHTTIIEENDNEGRRSQKTAAA
jgi:hypothetical protein